MRPTRGRVGNCSVTVSARAFNVPARARPVKKGDMLGPPSERKYWSLWPVWIGLNFLASSAQYIRSARHDLYVDMLYKACYVYACELCKLGQAPSRRGWVGSHQPDWRTLGAFLLPGASLHLDGQPQMLLIEPPSCVSLLGGASI